MVQRMKAVALMRLRGVPVPLIASAFKVSRGIVRADLLRTGHVERDRSHWQFGVYFPFKDRLAVLGVTADEMAATRATVEDFDNWIECADAPAGASPAWIRRHYGWR